MGTENVLEIREGLGFCKAGFQREDDLHPGRKTWVWPRHTDEQRRLVRAEACKCVHTAVPFLGEHSLVGACIGMVVAGIPTPLARSVHEVL